MTKKKKINKKIDEINQLLDQLEEDRPLLDELQHIENIEDFDFSKYFNAYD